MVKKNTGHSRRSSISKTAGGSQISSLKDLSLLDGSGLGQEETPELPPEPPTPDESHLGFPDPVYLLAAVIFQNTHLEKPAAHRLVSYGKRAGLPLPEAKDEAYQRSSYELAFNTLKYQELLEDIMIDSCFYLSQPMPDDQMSLVVVMLYDFQDRKFLPRECQGEELVQEVREVENCLLRFKTKLAASLARSRIKHDLLTIDCILPEAVRKKQERANRLLLYAWVNTFKSSLEEVCGVLKRGGFSQVNSVGQLEGQSFCQDPHCVDVLVFPPQLKADLYRTKLLSDNKLIIQDKWCSVGPCVVRSLLLPDGDVLMAGSSSGLTISHTASLVTHGNAHGNSQSKVFVCVGDRPPAQREELQEVLANMACKNVKLIPMSFLSLDPCDLRLQQVRVILLTPQCSVSAVSNPVEFILQENGDTDLLQDLSQGSIAQTKLDTLVAQQKRDIIHALKFPKVQVVVYSTCSLYPEENEEVVRGALEQAGPTEGPKLQAFRPSSSLPTSLGRAEERAGCPFFRLDPSDETNGCFLAVLTREPDLEEIESAQEVLARAAATGLLDGIDSNNPTRKERRGRQTHQAPISHARSAHTRPHATASSQSRVMEFLNRETKGCSSATTVGSTNGGLSQRGKAKPARRRPPKPSLSNSTSYTSPYPAPNPASSLSRKNQTCLINTAASYNNRHSPTATDPNPPAAPLTTAPFTPLVHPGPPKGRQEVLRPVALTLPPVLFPGYSPPARQIRNFPPPPQRSNPTLPCYQWKTSPPQVPLIKSSGSVNEKPVVKHPRPWL
ncbi:putative methyltransferase NSUN7 isoform X1 [Oncorhynchus mykiss]|uniref:NOP2/Sun RNA methyltransferase family member 7 n=1 Tax=Oncorhynchus mykiss TaxID=8022 RepID=A0A8C7NI18_ONCMY|nr:putative methyltransferase NSUN7 isoform X1 [Oncorhynchus mykiss]